MQAYISMNITRRPKFDDELVLNPSGIKRHGEIYKSHYIQTEHRLNLETDCWIPKAKISWEENGMQCIEILAGPADLFKIMALLPIEWVK
jgi:hypothetical protein